MVKKGPENNGKQWCPGEKTILNRWRWCSKCVIIISGDKIQEKSIITWKKSMTFCVPWRSVTVRELDIVFRPILLYCFKKEEEKEVLFCQAEMPFLSIYRKKKIFLNCEQRYLHCRSSPFYCELLSKKLLPQLFCDFFCQMLWLR